MTNFDDGDVREASLDDVAGTIPTILARIPADPAARLGRTGAPDDPVLHPGGQGYGPIRARAADPAGAAGPAVLAALRKMPALLVERLLGALELTVSGLEPARHWLSPPPPASGQFAMVGSLQGSSAAVSAATLAEALRPGTADLAEALARRAAAHPPVAALLAVPSEATDEAGIAARHGAGYLALGVAAAHAVVDPGAPDRAAAVLGMAIGTATMMLGEAEMPPGHPAAILAAVREQYLLPRSSSGSVTVAGHRFALVEGEVPAAVDFGGNGLLTVVDGGAVIRTGVRDGTVPVTLNVLADAPPEVESGWDEAVEVSWRAAHGRASVLGADGPADRHLRQQTPPWPGDYRLRVYAKGRDEGDERYQMVVWAAPAAPEIVHRRTDRLGHRLRGEPEPAERPERAYRWIQRSSLSVAATVTVVTGADVAQVLRAFGADPDRPEPIDELSRDRYGRMTADPWVAVLDAGPAVIAVEYNGYQGMQESVLGPASADGRAASRYWSAAGDTRLSFAAGGRLLASFEWLPADGVPPEVAEATAGIDFDGSADWTGKGLLAVQRFTGRGLLPGDLAGIEAAGIGYRIGPRA